MPADAGPPDPEELEALGTAAHAEVPAGTTMGPVHLTVSDLARSLEFYARAVGLELLARGSRHASLGAGGRELLVLVEERGAPPARGFTGLYHFALLLPQRRDLAAWLAHAARRRVPLVGLSDHVVSEALYLNDPDEHGIEIYWDRPREAWEGQVAERMTTLPLDVDSLLAELEDPAHEPFVGLPGGTVMGHVHLKVADVPDAVRFYRHGLGFGLMAMLGRQAAFFGAGGYHHHIGANSWESRGAGPPPPASAALRHATVVLPDAEARERILVRLTELGYPPREDGPEAMVADPSGNLLALRVA